MEREKGQKAPETISELGVLLEEVAHQVGVVAEGVLGNSERLDGLDKRLDGIDNRLDSIEVRLTAIESEVRSIREMLGTSEAPKVITREEYIKLDQRLSKVEGQLAAQKK